MNLVKYYIQGRQADTIQDMKPMNDCNLVNIAHEFVLEEGFSEADIIALAESHLVTKPWRFLWIASSEPYAISDELLRRVAHHDYTQECSNRVRILQKQQSELNETLNEVWEEWMQAIEEERKTCPHEAWTVYPNNGDKQCKACGEWKELTFWEQADALRNRTD